MLNKVNIYAIFLTFLLIYSLLRVKTYNESILKNVPKLNLMYQVTTAKCIAIHDSHFLRIVSALVCSILLRWFVTVPLYEMKNCRRVAGCLPFHQTEAHIHSVVLQARTKCESTQMHGFHVCFERVSYYHRETPVITSLNDNPGGGEGVWTDRRSGGSSLPPPSLLSLPHRVGKSCSPLWTRCWRRFSRLL